MRLQGRRDARAVAWFGILRDNGGASYRIDACRAAARDEGSVETDDLRKAGLKVTLPRLKILETLASSGGRHLSAEDIYRVLLDHGDDIGLATVYRVLTQFESVGLIKRHHFEGGTAVFELNQGEHHDHIICVDCGRVEEFMDCGIEERQLDVAQRLGFDVAQHNLILSDSGSTWRSTT
jgi:Fur family transcriptional regulator, ferric uptake regulator